MKPAWLRELIDHFRLFPAFLAAVAGYLVPMLVGMVIGKLLFEASVWVWESIW